ncbi:MAG: amino acid transporter [Phycisphaeraceae bacterium]|nr:MAG: amino acid transporter [Phycisphaeraceae bacterium]
MQGLNDAINAANGVLFSNYTVYALLLTGLLFTIWSGFGQFRALTHGVAVVRGKYDDKNDPGAINHFQALSAALSATVGLGNIGGVAVAVALGGPGAVLWMWVIGLLGMSLKMTEVTQSMLYRNTDDPDNPHGGPMFVVKKGFQKWGLGPIGALIGGLFVITLLISAITGGNMFQAWNVADITHTYFPSVPPIATGIILSIVVGLVIIGGIKRIGSVAGKIVPLMCVLYVLAALFVLIMNAGQIPAMLGLIVKSGLPDWGFLPGFIRGHAADPSGAFLGGTVGYAFIWGVKRALFSSEAGQGSSPIAHSAAKTDEPVREGVVAGLEPFIDTIVVCTLTALVILSSGAYNREAEATFAQGSDVRIVEARDADNNLLENAWTLESSALPRMTADARKIRRSAENAAGWRDGETIFVVVAADQDENTGRDLRRMTGTVSKQDAADGATDTWVVSWNTLESTARPTLRPDANGDPDRGIYGDYAAASMTAYAFDRTYPGLGMVVVTIAAWLFAISTMISWSYYGEQGIYYFFGAKGEAAAKPAVMLYKLVYCGLILLTTVAMMPVVTQADGTKRPLLGTDAELDMWTTLGLGVMLVVNIPIMLIFGNQAMKAYHGYFRKMKHGGDDAHAAPPFEDVVEGKDVE